MSHELPEQPSQPSETPSAARAALRSVRNISIGLFVGIACLLAPIVLIVIFTGPSKKPADSSPESLAASEYVGEVKVVPMTDDQLKKFSDDAAKYLEQSKLPNIPDKIAVVNNGATNTPPSASTPVTVSPPIKTSGDDDTVAFLQGIFNDMRTQREQEERLAREQQAESQRLAEQQRQLQNAKALGTLLRGLLLNGSGGNDGYDPNAAQRELERQHRAEFEEAMRLEQSNRDTRWP